MTVRGVFVKDKFHNSVLGGLQMNIQIVHVVVGPRAEFHPTGIAARPRPEQPMTHPERLRNRWHIT